MSESVALAGWRRRAGRRRERGRPSKTAVVVASVGCAVLAGRAIAPETGAAHTSPATAGPPPCPAVANAPQHSNAPQYSDAPQYSNALRADVDGDGCDDELSFSDGVLTAGAVRMRLGAAGDQVAVGRWTCGAAAVALLRPATGEVFRFDGWATAGRAVPAVALGRVDGAEAVHAAARPQSQCDDVVVTRRSGAPVIVPEQPVAG